MKLKKDGCVAGIGYLVSEWTAGIQLPGTHPPQRTLPVKQLEADKVNGRGDRRWRSGSKIRTTIAWKKHFWFAYERRTLGHPLSSNSSSDYISSSGEGGGTSDGSGGGSGGSSSSSGSGLLTRHQAVEDLEVMAR
mgnify:CR=1 FL=1